MTMLLIALNAEKKSGNFLVMELLCIVDDFANIFWDKVVEGILNVLKTQE